jgi:alanyl-tRNA synthetase
VVVENAAVETRVMAVEDASATGALALFGEKYGDEVRVVSMGGRAAEGRDAWSVELCGGTHVARTGDIGAIAVVGESAVGAGVRRIEALTGAEALAHLSRQDRALRDVASLLKTAPEEAPSRVAALIEERRTLERQLAEARKKLALAGTGGASADDIRELGAVKYLGRTVEGVAPKDLRGLVDDGKKKLGSGVVAIVGVTDEGKAGLVVGVTSDLVGRIDAVSLVKAGALAMGGAGGGGRPDMAQAGGPDGARAHEAIEAIAREISAMPA